MTVERIHDPGNSAARVRVVVTMPAYNAESTIERTLSDLPSSLQSHVILVDDASHDGTVDEGLRLGLRVVRHESNLGYGGNQKTCYREALDHGADVVVMLHPDYQYDPKAVPLLIAPVLSGDADMTFGSRFAGVADPRSGGMPVYRYIGNRVTTVAQNLLLGTRFTEMHSGMRAYSAEFLEQVPFESFPNGFEFDSAMMIHAISRGHRVVEVPIPTRYTEESSSIAIGPSLRYVAHGISKSAVARLRFGGRKARRMSAAGGHDPGPCTLCGSRDWKLKYPATADQSDVPVDEFACTTSAIQIHDDIFDCQQCGMRSSAPTLSHEEILDRYREVEDTEYLAEESERRELFKWALGQIPDATDGGRLLEFGSNVGLLLSEAERSGWLATGFEPSEWAVTRGRDLFGVDLRQGTVESAEVAAKADVVAMFDVLEHLSDPMAALRRVAGLCSSDGALLLSTVDTGSLHSRLRRGRWPWYIRSHLHYFTKTTLSLMLNEARMEIVGWTRVPRSFRLSYILYKGGWDKTWWARLLRLIPSFDPRIPTGWLGDIALVVAKPLPHDSRS